MTADFQRRQARLCQYLLFRQVAEHIGTAVTIESLEDVYGPVQAALKLAQPIVSTFSPEGMLAKHSILELDFETHSFHPTDQDAVTVALLQTEFGFHRDDWFFANLETSLLENRVIAKVLLAALHPPRDCADARNCSLKAGYFPRAFSVLDCCYTNSRFIWTHKYEFL